MHTHYRNERLAAEKAAQAAEKALDMALRHSSSRQEGGVEHEMKKPVEEAREEMAKKGASEIIAYAFK